MGILQHGLLFPKGVPVMHQQKLMKDNLGHRWHPAAEPKWMDHIYSFRVSFLGGGATNPILHIAITSFLLADSGEYLGSSDSVLGVNTRCVINYLNAIFVSRG